MDNLKMKLEEARKQYVQKVSACSEWKIEEGNPFYDAYYAGFEDGYHRASEKQYPAGLEKLQPYYNDGFKDGANEEFKEWMFDHDHLS